MFVDKIRIEEKTIIRNFLKSIWLKKYFGMITINRKKMTIYNDSNLIDIEVKKKIKYETSRKYLPFTRFTSVDRKTFAKQTLAPAAKILAPV